MKTNFFRTLSIIRRNKFVNPYWAILRHMLWVIRKIFNAFPCDLKLGNRIVHVANLSVANGSGALVNAMGYYDPNNMLFLREIFQKGLYQFFFDVGANIGVYSLIVTDRAEQARAYAFEPHPQTFSLLHENVHINELDDRITCVQVALGERDGGVSFMDAAGSPQNRIVEEGMGKGLITVEITRGEKICQREEALPQVLKIDVEGYENQVLAGFGETLHEVQLVFVECWSLEKTTDLLCGKLGFLGPYKMNYRTRTFVREDVSEEDWIFMNKQALPMLTSIGFRVSN